MDGGIKFDVSARTAKFDADMARVGNSATTTAKKIKNAFSGLGGLLAGGAVAAGLKSLMSDFDRVGKLATRFGTSAESIQRVSVAAEIAGTNIEQVANAMTKAGVAASQAVEKGGEMAETFKRAGINAQQFANAQLDQKLLMVAEAFAAAEGDANKTNAIIEILGTRAGANLIPLISNVQALKDEMAGVAVASDDMVRKIEEANDRFTRLGNEGKVAVAGLIEGIVSISERLGNVISEQDKLLKLLAALPLALTGNVNPLWEVLQTGKTIKELEEIEARANAINQLTREGAFGMDAVRNAEMISERTKQILEQTRGTAQQIQIAEDSTDRVLDIEKEKTSELERQQRALERQEEQRQKAIRSMEMEVRLIEAQLSGNKDLEESLREQADFDAAMEKTGDTEVASKFSAAKAAQRAAQDREAASSGGGSFRSSPQATRPPSMRDLAAAGNVDAMTAQLRSENVQNRYQDRVNRLVDEGKFRSAAQAMRRASNRAQRDEDRFLGLNYLKEQGMGNNFGEGYSNFRREFGLDADAIMEKTLGDKFDPTKSAEENFKRMAIEQAKTPQERQQEEEEMRAKHAPKGGGGSDPISQIYALLTTHLPKIDEKLPQHALA